MRLLITTPTAVVIDDRNVTAARAEDESGSFGILTGHADLLTALNVSIVSWRGVSENERYCAVRRGVLSVTNGNEVAIATREAVPGDDLERLEHVVIAELHRRFDTERASRTESSRSVSGGGVHVDRHPLLPLDLTKFARPINEQPLLTMLLLTTSSNA